MGQPCQGFGAGQGAGACRAVVCAAALQGTVEHAAAADAQGDSQACGIAVLVVGEVIPVVLEAVSAQVGVGDAFLLLLLPCRAWSPWGRELQL